MEVKTGPEFSNQPMKVSGRTRARFALRRMMRNEYFGEFQALAEKRRHVIYSGKKGEGEEGEKL